ncbi:MAG TPA: hypothetical protein VI685_16210 [Candidatus Angelobacter sp.]
MKRLLGLLLVVLGSMCVWAQTPDCTSLSQQALELSGVNLDLDALGQMLLSDDFMNQSSGQQAAEVMAVLKPIMRKNLDAASMKKELLHRIVARCTQEKMNQVIQELQSPFVARMLLLENARHTPEGQEKAKKYERIIKIAPPPDSQLDTADAFDEKVHVSDFTVDSLMAVTRGMLQGAGAPDEALAELDSHRKELKAQIQGGVLATILMTYSGVNKADLTKYSVELSSGPLQWYYEAVHQSLVEMLEHRAQAIGRDMKAAVLSKQSGG